MGLFRNLITRRALGTLISQIAVGDFSSFANTSPGFGQSPEDNFQSWLNKKSGNRVIKVDFDPSPILIKGSVRIPPNVEIIFHRNLSGVAGSELLISGNTKLRFVNSECHDVMLRIESGNVLISGLIYKGRENIAAILIDGPGPFSNIVIEEVFVSHANYGILRQGGNSVLKGAIIRHCRFLQLYGDAIEWNVCPHDRQVFVEYIDIDTISDPIGRPNWGIGIGFAGRKYSPNWEGDQIEEFTIRHVRGERVRQLVHVEAGKRFRIESISGSQILDRYSSRSNMPSALIACYGCKDFEINQVYSDTGDIIILAGAFNNQYVVPSKNFILKDIKLGDGSLKTEMGGSGSYAYFENITMIYGQVKFQGKVSDLRISNFDSKGSDEKFKQNIEFLSGNLLRFRPASSVFTHKIVKSGDQR